MKRGEQQMLSLPYSVPLFGIRMLEHLLIPATVKRKMEPQEIFINKAGRLRSGWRFVIFALLFWVAAQLTLGIFALLVSSALGERADAFLHSSIGNIADGFIILALAILVGWLCGKLFEGLPLRALGWAFQPGWFLDWIKGSLIGALSLLLATGIAFASGGFRFKLHEAGITQDVIETIIFSALFLILSAALEEAIFRGYPLQTMTRAQLAWFGVIITSLIFSLAHRDNPSFSIGFPFINTLLAGVWLAVAYLRTRNLWFPLGIHWAWNWTMSALLGIPVSGITSVAPNPLLRASDLGPAWLTGGSYGIEGGAACAIALLVSTIFIWRTRFVCANEEMLRLTAQENPRRIPEPLRIFESNEEAE